MPLIRLLQLLTLVALLASAVSSQKAPQDLSQGRAKILLLGTFHFDDAGLDDYKPKYRVDILSDQRQKEIAEVLNVLKAFGPNKIGVEWPVERQSALDAEFATYSKGNPPDLGPNEIYQIGFRLAVRLGHPRIYAVDARAMALGPNPSTEALIERARSLGQDELVQRGTQWSRWYDEWYAYEDSLKTKETILQHLRFLNSPAELRRSHGRYLVAEFEVGGRGDYTGADSKTGWYNRNLRIFSNIERVRTAGSDRILVIIGAGHVPILQHLAENAPEYELVPCLNVLGGNTRSSSSRR